MTPRSGPAAIPEYDPQALLSDLLQIGSHRADQEAAGGALFAGFADFCWHTAAPLSAGHFELWLATLNEDPPDPVDVAAARRMLEVLL